MYIAQFLQKCGNEENDYYTQSLRIASRATSYGDRDFTKEELLDIIPQGRFISPDEIASFALYLASDEAKGLTGQSINLCAGMSVGG